MTAPRFGPTPFQGPTLFPPPTPDPQLKKKKKKKKRQDGTGRQTAIGEW